MNENSRLARASGVYKTIAIITFSSVALFAFLNLVVYAWSEISAHLKKSESQNQINEWYGNDIDLTSVYPDLSMDQINEMLGEIWNRPYAYRAYTQFCERPFRGKYVNVSDVGFRGNGRELVWPPNYDTDFVIFVFGGSTTFGYGLPDSQTVPAHLERNLNSRSPKRAVKVYNFGCGYHFSTQERVLFECLIADKHLPHLAVFIDGFNDFSQADYGDPRFTYDLGLYLDDRCQEIWTNSGRITMGRAFRNLVDSLPVSAPLGVRMSLAGRAPPPRKRFAPDVLFSKIIDRYVTNKKLAKLVADGSGVKTLFVWQPISGYKYDRKHDLFGRFGLGKHAICAKGYPAMAQYVSTHDMGKDFLWCADMQEQMAEALYVDRFHYTNKLAGLLAAKIADEIRARFVDLRRPLVDSAVPCVNEPRG